MLLSLIKMHSQFLFDLAYMTDNISYYAVLSTICEFYKFEKLKVRI